MLVVSDFTQREYTIGVNESTGTSELLADMSYLAEAPHGHIVFDFTHMASSLTQAIAPEHIPGQFGFHPLDRIIEQISFIGQLVEMPLLANCPHDISVVLPFASSHLGRFFTQLGVFSLLSEWDLPAKTHDVWEPVGARDDDSRCVLVPLTDVRVNHTGVPDSTQMEEARRRITDEIVANFDSADVLAQFPRAIIGIMEGIAEFVRGGLLASLYFPSTGYLEMSMMNRTEGATGIDPDEQLEALVSQLEATPPNLMNVLDQVTRFYGTIQLWNGFASVLISPDGSFHVEVERTDLRNVAPPGPRATVVLQLPAKPILWDTFAYERVSTMWSSILN